MLAGSAAAQRGEQEGADTELCSLFFLNLIQYFDVRIMISFIVILDLFVILVRCYWVYFKTFGNVGVKGMDNDREKENNKWQADEEDD